jgi:hypothetical protein
MLIVSRFLIKVLTFNNHRVSAIALWPIIVFRNQRIKENRMILNHEKIHHRQQLECLILPFYLIYFLEYFIYLCKYKFKHQQAYMSISFEKEAYDHQDNFSYLSFRKPYSHFKYLFKQ